MIQITKQLLYALIEINNGEKNIFEVTYSKTVFDQIKKGQQIQKGRKNRDKT